MNAVAGYTYARTEYQKVQNTNLQPRRCSGGIHMPTSLAGKKIELARIGEKEYRDFCSLLEWRRTGVENGDVTSYVSDELQTFFADYNVLESGTFFIFAARVDGRFVGYATAAVIPKPDPRRGILYVDELWVAEPYRLGGIATMLMQEALSIARSLKLWRVRLYVGMDNLAARNYYRKMGFAEKGDAVWCEYELEDSK